MMYDALRTRTASRCRHGTTRHAARDDAQHHTARKLKLMERGRCDGSACETDAAAHAPGSR
jgi:hypothetical protein